MSIDYFIVLQILIYLAPCSHTLYTIVSSTFSKVALHAQWRGYGARSPVVGVSFVSFSLRLFCQRKAAKESWCLKIAPLTIDIKISLSLFLLPQEAQKKKLCKKKMPGALEPRGLCYAQGGRF